MSFITFCSNATNFRDYTDCAFEFVSLAKETAAEYIPRYLEIIEESASNHKTAIFLSTVTVYFTVGMFFCAIRTRKVYRRFVVNFQRSNARIWRQAEKEVLSQPHPANSVQLQLTFDPKKTDGVLSDFEKTLPLVLPHLIPCLEESETHSLAQLSQSMYTSVQENIGLKNRTVFLPRSLWKNFDSITSLAMKIIHGRVADDSRYIRLCPDRFSNQLDFEVLGEALSYLNNNTAPDLEEIFPFFYPSGRGLGNDPLKANYARQLRQLSILKAIPSFTCLQIFHSILNHQVNESEEGLPPMLHSWHKKAGEMIALFDTDGTYPIDQDEDLCFIVQAKKIVHFLKKYLFEKIYDPSIDESEAFPIFLSVLREGLEESDLSLADKQLRADREAEIQEEFASHNQPEALSFFENFFKAIYSFIALQSEENELVFEKHFATIYNWIEKDYYHFRTPHVLLLALVAALDEKGEKAKANMIFDKFLENREIVLFFPDSILRLLSPDRVDALLDYTVKMLKQERIMSYDTIALSSFSQFTSENSILDNQMKDLIQTAEGLKFILENQEKASIALLMMMDCTDEFWGDIGIVRKLMRIMSFHDHPLLNLAVRVRGLAAIPDQNTREDLASKILHALY